MLFVNRNNFATAEVKASPKIKKKSKHRKQSTNKNKNDSTTSRPKSGVELELDDFYQYEIDEMNYADDADEKSFNYQLMNDNHRKVSALQNNQIEQSNLTKTEPKKSKSSTCILV